MKIKRRMFTLRVSSELTVLLSSERALQDDHINLITTTLVLSVPWSNGTADFLTYQIGGHECFFASLRGISVAFESTCQSAKLSVRMASHSDA